MLATPPPGGVWRPLSNSWGTGGREPPAEPSPGPTVETFDKPVKAQFGMAQLVKSQLVDAGRRWRGSSPPSLGLPKVCWPENTKQTGR